MLTAALVLALAAAPLVDLVYAQDVAACPDRKTLAATVSGWLGHSPFDENAQRAAHVRLMEDGERLTGTLELFDGGKRVGRQTFTSAQMDCRELAASVAMALLKAIDPMARDPRVSLDESVGTAMVVDLGVRGQCGAGDSVRSGPHTPQTAQVGVRFSCRNGAGLP